MYKEAYESKFSEEVSGFGGYAYDAFGLLVRAVEVGGADREKVRAALEGTKGFLGTSASSPCRPPTTTASTSTPSRC